MVRENSMPSVGSTVSPSAINGARTIGALRSALAEQLRAQLNVASSMATANTLADLCRHIWDGLTLGERDHVWSVLGKSMFVHYLEEIMRKERNAAISSVEKIALPNLSERAQAERDYDEVQTTWHYRNTISVQARKERAVEMGTRLLDSPHLPGYYRDNLRAIMIPALYETLLQTGNGPILFGDAGPSHLYDAAAILRAKAAQLICQAERYERVGQTMEAESCSIVRQLPEASLIRAVQGL